MALDMTGRHQLDHITRAVDPVHAQPFGSMRRARYKRFGCFVGHVLVPSRELDTTQAQLAVEANGYMFHLLVKHI